MQETGSLEKRQELRHRFLFYFYEISVKENNLAREFFSQLKFFKILCSFLTHLFLLIFNKFYFINIFLLHFRLQYYLILSEIRIPL
jgi:hypothetical protein